MTYNDAKEKITALVATPETAQTAAIDLLAELEKDYAQIDSLTAAKEEADSKIRTLQDTNQRLFLMQTSQVTPEKDELQGHEAVDAFVKELMKEED